MEILSDSSIHKTFESQSLTETEDIKEFEESISESIGSSRSAQETSASGNNVSSRGEKFEDSQSTLESLTSETVTSSSGHSHSSGTPEHDTSSVSSSPSSDSRNGEGTVDPSKYFLKRCIRATNQNSMKHSSRASDSSPQKAFEAEFCSNCIKAIKSGHQIKRVKPTKHTETTPLVDPLVVEKLKFENLMHAMREVTTKQEDTDDIQNCKVCRNWKSRVDETTFLTENIRHLKKQLTEWRLQQHLITMDSLNQIGDLASGLPKVSEPSQKVWEKLLKK